MDLLQQMVSLMNRKDVKHFKVFSSRSVEADRKDLRLFDYIRKLGNNFDEDKAFSELYNVEDKNAFYRLKNRLTTDLGKSIFLQNHHINNSISATYFLALGNYYQYEKNHHRLALHFYQKAEKRAESADYYTLLDVIFTHMIKLMVEEGAVNPENYIKKRQESSQLLEKLREVDDVLQVLEYQMKISQGLAGTNTNQVEKLQKLADEYSNDVKFQNNTRLKFGLYQLISRMLLQQKNYKALQDYLNETFNNFIQAGIFDKNSHRQKLQIIAWLANAAFMNKNYNKSLEYAEELRLEMDKYDKLYFKDFVFFYYNILIINNSAINPEKAISILQDLSNKEKLKELRFNSIFIHYNLSLLYFQKKKYSSAIQSLNKLYHTEEFLLANPLLKLKAQIGELVIRYELKETDFITYRTKQIVKENKELLEELIAEKESYFLDIFLHLSEKPKLLHNKIFRLEVEEYLQKFKAGFDADDALFKVNNWLAEKFKINL